MSGAGHPRVKRTKSVTGHVIGSEVSNEEYFMDRISPVPESGCWLWTGHVNENGYGRIRRGEPVTTRMYAHRFAYEHFIGPIPRGMHILHSCDAPSCCNPSHLRVGTDHDNVQDMIKRGRNKCGEDAPNVKLTTEQVKRIIHDTRPSKIVAAEYGISFGHVGDIRAGNRWKKVYAAEKRL